MYDSYIVFSCSFVSIEKKRLTLCRDVVNRLCSSKALFRYQILFAHPGRVVRWVTGEIHLVEDLAAALLHAQDFVDGFDLVVVGRHDALLLPRSFQFRFEVVERLRVATLVSGHGDDAVRRDLLVANVALRHGHVAHGGDLIGCQGHLHG